MRFFLGLDGGQSSTTALIGDGSGGVVGFGRGGPCNHVSDGERRAKFLRVVGECIDKACRQAGVPGRDFESVCLGFSGGAQDKAALVPELLSAAHLLVSHDALIAYVGACGGEPGVVAIAGTGSIAFGRGADGREARAGGWGYVFGDEGGAFDIVRQALRAALRFEEGWGAATSLRDRLLAAAEGASANELLHRLYTPEWPRSRVATLSKIVNDAAIKGDTVAANILDDAGAALAKIAMAVRGQLFAEGESCRVSYVGGVFRSARVLARFREEFAGGVTAPEYGPAAGALIEAYRIAGMRPQLTNLPEFEK